MIDSNLTLQYKLIQKYIFHSTNTMVMFLQTSVLLDFCVLKCPCLNFSLSLYILWMCECQNLSFLKTICKNSFLILATFYHVKCFDKCSFVVFVVHVVIVCCRESQKAPCECECVNVNGV